LSSGCVVVGTIISLHRTDQDTAQGLYCSLRLHLLHVYYAVCSILVLVSQSLPNLSNYTFTPLFLLHVNERTKLYITDYALDILV